MKWSETNNSSATGKTEAKAQMYAVDAFSPEEASSFAKTMFKRRCEGWGDETQALEEVSGWCGLSPRSFKRLMKGETKDVGIGLYRRVRMAYLNYTLRLIAQLQNEVKTIEEVHGHAAVGDIMASVEALEAKARAAKEIQIQHPRPANRR